MLHKCQLSFKQLNLFKINLYPQKIILPNKFHFSIRLLEKKNVYFIIRIYKSVTQTFLKEHNIVYSNFSNLFPIYNFDFLIN